MLSLSSIMDMVHRSFLVGPTVSMKFRPSSALQVSQDSPFFVARLGLVWSFEATSLMAFLWLSTHCTGSTNQRLWNTTDTLLVRMIMAPFFQQGSGSNYTTLVERDVPPEEDLAKLAQRFGLIQHLPTGLYDGGKKDRE